MISCTFFKTSVNPQVVGTVFSGGSFPQRCCFKSNPFQEISDDQTSIYEKGFGC